MPSCRNSNLLVMTAVPGVRSEREEGGGDGQTANTNWGKPAFGGHPEAAIRNKIYCGQSGKYLKNQSHKHLSAGEELLVAFFFLNKK